MRIRKNPCQTIVQVPPGTGGLRVFAWAMFWASLAHLSWLAFRLAQARLQPDAIATGLPGLLYRLVIRPAEGLFRGSPDGAVAQPALQIATLMAICTVILVRSWARIAGGERHAAVKPVGIFPGRRETTWK